MRRNILVVFLASPGDLSEERKLLDSAVRLVNRFVGSELGWQIDLRIWKETYPSFSRPQQVINPDVDICDLFIGMLWERWGEPTNGYSSGFEEEFLRARKRKIQTGSPEMWLFFKKVEESKKKDPGKQLQKVLKFKNLQKKKKELKFEEFDSLEKWRDRIPTMLAGYLLTIQRAKQLEGIESQETQLKSSPEVKQVQAKIQAKETPVSYPHEITNIFLKLNNEVLKDGANSLDPSERSRLFLLVNAWFTEEFNYAPIGPHEANILYHYRKKWQISNEEIIYLFRLGIKSEHDNIPFWCWFGNVGDDYLTYLLCSFATNDPKALIRKSAFSLLEKIKFIPDINLLQKGLSDSNKSVIYQVITYIKNTQNKTYLKLLKPFRNSQNTNLRYISNLATIYILLNEAPNKAFKELMSSQIEFYNQDIFTIKWFEYDLDKNLLLRALHSKRKTIVRIALQCLRKKGMLPEDICLNYINDSDIDIRKEAILGLLNLGIYYDVEKIRELNRAMLWTETEKIVQEFMKMQDPQQLLSAIYFYKQDGYNAYRILATEHFDLIKHRIRSDLNDGFEQLRIESENHISERIGENEMLKIAWWRDEKQKDFYNAQYISAALAGLAKNEKKSDIFYARKHLGKTLYHIADLECIWLLKRYGDSSDVNDLLNISTIDSVLSDIKKEAIKVSIILSKNHEELILNAIERNDSSFLKESFRCISELPKENKINIAKQLLSFFDDEIRLKALSLITRTLNENQLKELLDEYLLKETYYYNVVTWLDRYLYSNGCFKHYYHKYIQNYLKI